MSVIVALLIAAALVMIGIGISFPATRVTAFIAGAILLYILSLGSWLALNYFFDLTGKLILKPKLFFTVLFLAVPLVIPVVFLVLTKRWWQK